MNSEGRVGRFKTEHKLGLKLQPSVIPALEAFKVDAAAEIDAVSVSELYKKGP
jgi:hypothetical protein